MGKRKSQFGSIFITKTLFSNQKKKSLQNLFKTLFLNPLSLQFRQPLDWERQGLINYNLVIEKPMDLATVKKNLQNQIYLSVEDCLDDIELIFQNSLFYNKGTQWIEDLTNKCEKVFLKLVKNYFPQVKTKNDSECKKSLKRKKIQQKHNLSQKTEPNNQNLTQSHEEQVKIEDPTEQISTILPPNENNTQKQIELSNLRDQLFELIHQASQKSLQIVYLMIKSQDTTIIGAQRNGNCRIDVKHLPKEFIVKLITFLKEQKKRQNQDALKINTIKIKRKIISEKSRYEI